MCVRFFLCSLPIQNFVEYKNDEKNTKYKGAMNAEIYENNIVIIIILVSIFSEYFVYVLKN